MIYVGSHIISGSPDLCHSVSHGDTKGCSPDQSQIVHAVADGYGMLPGGVKVFQNFCGSVFLAGCSRNNDSAAHFISHVKQAHFREMILNVCNGLRGIGFTDNGSRCFYTTFPVETIEDFSGRTIRVQQNHVMLSLVSLLGANPVNVSANEMYSALQTGVCQGGENNLNTILADSLYEVAKYVTLDNHTTGMDTIVFNLDVWNSFSEEDQQMMLRAMDEATAYDREIWDASIEDAKAKLTAGGAIITTPAPEVQDSFFDAMAPLYEEDSVEYGDWIESINEVLGR